MSERVRQKAFETINLQSTAGRPAVYGGTKMNHIIDFLPFLIPLVIAQLILLIYTLHHILTHKKYKRGNRALWLVVTLVGMEFVGPILYFLLGKEDI